MSDLYFVSYDCGDDDRIPEWYVVRKTETRGVGEIVNRFYDCETYAESRAVFLAKSYNAYVDCCVRNGNPIPTHKQVLGE